MNQQRGFTLLEVMVATAILAVGLSAVSGGFSMSARATALAGGYEQARQVAETQLALFLAGEPDVPRPFSDNGRDEGVSWQLDAAPDVNQEGLLSVRIETRFFAAGERRWVLDTWQVDRELPDRDSQTTESSS